MSVVAWLLLSGCTTVRWYGQATAGQLELLLKREDIEKRLASDDLTEKQREGLQTIIAARQFAVDSLALPDNGSFGSVVTLDRDAVVWNVIAAPQFDLRPKTWCYPFAGCLAYRGWFDQNAAEREADRLAAEGFDVRVAPVLAYSTLGWFADPVTSPLFKLDDRQLAGLVFHELAHQRIFVAGDTVFSESYATAVERAGLRLWLADTTAASAWREAQAASMARSRWLQALAAELAALYAQPLDRSALRAAKQACFDGLAKAAPRFRQDHGAARPPRASNNADLALVSIYEQGAGAFEHLLAEYGSDFQRFHAAVERLADAGPERRAAFLKRSVRPPPARPPTFCPPAHGLQ